MKKLVFVLIWIPFVLSACGRTPAAAEKVIPVTVVEVTSQKYQSTLQYVGVVSGDSVIKHSFKTSAVVKKIYVPKGARVSAGDALMALDTSDLELQAAAAGAQMDSAFAQYKKALSGAQSEDIRVAEINMNTAKVNLEVAKMEYDGAVELYSIGAVAKLELEKARLQYESALGQYEQAQALYEKAKSGSRPEDISFARSQYEAAKANADAMLKLISESTLTAGEDGFVVDVLFSEGELVAAGYPAVITRGNTQTVAVGVSQEDVAKISTSTAATVLVSGKRYEGAVKSVVPMPDESSRTYPVEIEVSDIEGNISLGSAVKVSFIMGAGEGILLPVRYISNDGRDFVFVEKDGRAYRRDLSIGELFDDKVYAEGIAEGDNLIISGVKSLTEGCAVTVSAQTT